MKLTRSLLALAVNFSLILPAIFVLQTQTVFGQTTTSTALQRGYRTGYSDGYMAGYRDTIDSLDKSITRHREYEAADRAYNKDFGQLEDYRDGYRQGFEKGYETGFEKRTFDSTTPADMSRKGLNTNPSSVSPVVSEPPPPPQAISTDQDQTTPPPAPIVNEKDETITVQKVSYSGDSIVIPKDTEFVLELQNDISTQTAREGEKFTATVVSPSELQGAVVEVRVEKLQQPGRIKRPAELQLAFERIVISGERWGNFSGMLVEVMPIQGDNVRRVTDEGTAIGQSSIKGDATRVGISTGAGAGIGAVAGGPIGAAVGAGIGAAFGIGSAMIERGKHIRLNKNQQLKVRSSYEVNIR
ncbi:MAG TPA: hypothetical protein VJ781_06850 [Pyrinomonadaceae bacterium]|nr:hypothetical protein [Pyrinomonadaceae bacterium]